MAKSKGPQLQTKLNINKGSYSISTELNIQDLTRNSANIVRDLLKASANNRNKGALIANIELNGRKTIKQALEVEGTKPQQKSAYLLAQRAFTGLKNKLIIFNGVEKGVPTGITAHPNDILHYYGDLARLNTRGTSEYLSDQGKAAAKVVSGTAIWVGNGFANAGKGVYKAGQNAYGRLSGQSVAVAPADNTPAPAKAGSSYSVVTRTDNAKRLQERAIANQNTPAVGVRRVGS